MFVFREYGCTSLALASLWDGVAFTEMLESLKWEIITQNNI